MAPRRLGVARGALLSAAAAALASRALAFDSPLGGSSNEQPTFTSLGAGALQLAPPLTTYDPDVSSLEPAPRVARLALPSPRRRWHLA